MVRAHAFLDKSERGNVESTLRKMKLRGVAEQQADRQAGWHSGRVLCTLKTAAEKNSHGIAKCTL